MTIRFIATTAVAAVVAASVLGAQSAPSVSYVASVKRNTSGGGRGGIQMQPGRMVATNMPIVLLIRQAYGPLQDSQLVGGPAWINTDRFDIDARLEGPPNPVAMQAMLRALFAERFKLVVHNESRDLPVYALVLARSDGRLGPVLKPSEPECVAMIAAGPRRGGPGPDGRSPLLDGRGGPPPVDGSGRGGPPPGQQGSGTVNGRPLCGSRGGGFGQLRAGGQTMAQFSELISQVAQRMVIDKTGLTGVFDIELSFTPTPDQLPPGPPPPGAPVPQIDPNGPSLFTAVQEQLGLKLESQRGPVDVLVIEHVEEPTEN